MPPDPRGSVYPRPGMIAKECQKRNATFEVSPPPDPTQTDPSQTDPVRGNSAQDPDFPANRASVFAEASERHDNQLSVPGKVVRCGPPLA